MNDIFNEIVALVKEKYPHVIIKRVTYSYADRSEVVWDVTPSTTIRSAPIPKYAQDAITAAFAGQKKRKKWWIFG